MLRIALLASSTGLVASGWSAPAFAQDAPAAEEAQAIVITGRDGNGLWGGRVTSLTLRGSSGKAALSGTDLQFALGAQKPYTKASGWSATVAYTFSAAKQNNAANARSGCRTEPS